MEANLITPWDELMEFMNARGCIHSIPENANTHPISLFIETGYDSCYWCFKSVEDVFKIVSSEEFVKFFDNDFLINIQSRDYDIHY